MNVTPCRQVYGLLLSVAALPAWLSARAAAPWELRPMPLQQAATVIQSTLRAHLARRQIQVRGKWRGWREVAGFCVLVSWSRVEVCGALGWGARSPDFPGRALRAWNA